MNYPKIKIFIWLLCATCFISACNKYLNAKPDKSLAIPKTLEDYQALLDYYPTMNTTGVSVGEVSADDYYLSDADWASQDESHRKIYLWLSDTIFTPQYNDWASAYKTIYTTNTVLGHIDQIQKTKLNRKEWNNVKGEALFFRANSFLQVATVWSKGYDPKTANQDLGIPLRMTTDFNIPSKRASLKKTFDQIIKDLKEATNLLPKTQIHPMRPGKPAAYGLLARTYLYMGDYENAALYADSSLTMNSTLMDYNGLDSTHTYPIPSFNIEVLFSSQITPVASPAKIDSDLVNEYESNDLRKSLFLNNNGDGTFSYRGSYMASGSLFTGVATDEMYLTRSECDARAGNLPKAMSDLNELLVKRWKTGTFVPYTATDQSSALDLILTERRKELLMRGIRWMDLKRLNLDGRNIILRRKINNELYTLAPNANRYALPIPEDLIQLTGMKQNPL